MFALLARAISFYKNLARLLCLSGLLSTVTLTEAGANVFYPNIEGRFSSSDLTWTKMQPMTVRGVPISVARFSSRRSSVGIAELFSEHDVFQRVLTLPGKVVLSGLEDDWHWLAAIDDHKTGSKGYVSIMRTGFMPRNTELATRPGSAFESWIPPHAASVFNHDIADENESVSLRTYSIALPLAAIGTQLLVNLTKQGWGLLDHSSLSTGPWHWRRQHERLSIYATALAETDTSVFIQYVRQRDS